MTGGYDGVFFGEAFDARLAEAWAMEVLVSEGRIAPPKTAEAAEYARHCAYDVAGYMSSYSASSFIDPGELAELGADPQDEAAVYAAMAWRACEHWQADNDWCAEHFRERCVMDPVEADLCRDFVARHPERPGARPGDDAAPPAFTPYAELGARERGYVLHDDPDIRAQAAEEGWGLDLLAYDPSSHVREEVAEQGYALDTLVSDPVPAVRQAVARQGYGLDKLVSDGEPYVRATVARQGYGLDMLVADGETCVRQAVAEGGYGLDALSLDADPDVALAARKRLIAGIGDPSLYPLLANCGEIPADDPRLQEIIGRWAEEHPGKCAPARSAAPRDVLEVKRVEAPDIADDLARAGERSGRAAGLRRLLDLGKGMGASR